MAPAASTSLANPPPALLTDATWYGTLAAARDLAAHGVPVTLALDRALAPARWSRHVSRTVRSPPTSDAPRFLEWLHAFAERHPGHAYYPSSDDAAWLVSAHRGSLEPRLRLHAPPLASLCQLLDKSLLAQAARTVGVAMPETWSPVDPTEVERLSRELPFPLLVKPRTQLLAGGSKGRIVDRREDLLRTWTEALHANRVAPDVLAHLPLAALPLLQAYHPSSERIYTLDGFVGPDDSFAIRACTKLIQLPRGSGPGIAFEDAGVDAALAEGLHRLFRQVGYTGVFDVEFVRGRDRLLLIDVNPRYYNHMAFEVDRGMCLPWMAYLAALGERRRLRDVVRAASAQPAGSGRVYLHRNAMALLLAFQRLSGSMSRPEVAVWRAWAKAHDHDCTDPASEPGDGRTALADRVFLAKKLLRHPRSSLRELTRGGRSPPAAAALTPTP